MSPVQIRDMQPEDLNYVATCTHVGERDETTASGQRRAEWIRQMQPHGLCVKMAIVDGQRAGFSLALPIERSARGLCGHDLMLIPCLFVEPDRQRRGAGRALIEAAQAEARARQRKGIAVAAFDHDFWFMPAAFFRNCGFVEAARSGNLVAMWKRFESDAAPPRLPAWKYTFTPVPGKVAIDLFWSCGCLTIVTEVERVRQVAAEFGDNVVLREFCADDPDVYHRYERSRGIFIDGREIFWGYEAPKEGIRDAIHQALATRERTNAASH
jgi:GNAT superfamily N-acetyltransferase